MADTCLRCGVSIPEGEEICALCGLPVRANVLCSACGSRVRKADDYCWTCGAPLEHPFHCWHCGSAVWSGSTYCSSCGAPQPDLRELLQAMAEREQSRLPFDDRRSHTVSAAGQREPAPPRTAERPTAEPRTGAAIPRAADTAVESGLAPVLEAPQAADEERLKIVTVLFADVSGFTEMSENLHPEEVKDLMNDCFAGLTEAITSRGGTIDKYIGDCVMAVFGVPVARYDDAERSIDAALAMQDFLGGFSEDLERRTGRSLAMRIGINTGQVMAGYVGHGESRDFTVMGDAVNVASRLESACPVGSILASQETYRMVRGLYRVNALEPISVKGKQDSVAVVEVVGRRPGGVELRQPTFLGVPTRMIGRDRELNQLRSAFGKARQGRQVVLATVRSPLGQGKSRLINEFAGWLVGEAGIDLDLMRCRDYRTGSTYAPLVELLRLLTRARGGEDADTILELVHEGMRQLGLSPEEHEASEAALAHLLGMPVEAIPHLAPLAQDPERLEQAVREGLVSGYRVRALRAPVVMAVEDVHAASVSFLDLLSDLAALEGVPLLIILTYRPDADAVVEERFAGRDPRIKMYLAPLTDVDAAEMVRDLLQHAEPVAANVVQRVVEVSQGNPLFIAEILADLADRGAISHDGERWEVDAARIRNIVLPQSVEAAILSRVDALPGPSRKCLQVASVVGEVGWEGLVAALGVPEAGAVLDDLRRRELIEFRRASRIPDEREFFFQLPAVREAVERHVLRKVKSGLHRSIAEWLEARVEGGREEFDRLLAHHYYAAGDPLKALPFRLRAGGQAEDRGDTVRALEDLTWVWLQARDASGTPRIDPAELLGSRVRVARLLRRVGRPAEASEAFDETRETLGVLASQRHELDIVLWRAGLETARSLLQAGERSSAAALLDEILAHRTTDEPEACRLAAAAIKQQGWIDHLERKYKAALQKYDQGIALVEALEPCAELGSLLDGKGVCLTWIKRHDEAEAAFDLARKTARAVGNRAGEGSTVINLGVLRQQQARHEEALLLFREARGLFESVGDVVEVAICQANSGESLLALDRASEARAELESARSTFRRTRSLDYRAETLQILIECCRRLADREAEEEQILELIDVAEQIGRPRLRRLARGLACRLAAERGAAGALAEHLAAWREIPEPGDNDRSKLRELVGLPDAALRDALPADLRELLEER